jgi:hypothetical protein
LENSANYHPVDKSRQPKGIMNNINLALLRYTPGLKQVNKSSWSVRRHFFAVQQNTLVHTLQHFPRTSHPGNIFSYAPAPLLILH